MTPPSSLLMISTSQCRKYLFIAFQLKDSIKTCKKNFGAQDSLGDCIIDAERPTGAWYMTFIPAYDSHICTCVWVWPKNAINILCTAKLPVVLQEKHTYRNVPLLSSQFSVFVPRLTRVWATQMLIRSGGNRLGQAAMDTN